jgi:hypothetical protein
MILINSLMVGQDQSSCLEDELLDVVLFSRLFKLPALDSVVDRTAALYIRLNPGGRVDPSVESPAGDWPMFIYAAASPSQQQTVSLLIPAYIMYFA